MQNVPFDFAQGKDCGLKTQNVRDQSLSGQ
jgi:hypothetical protein